jgi:hypothetical protein
MANIFKINAEGLRIPLYAGTPASVENGLLWYDTTANAFKRYENGATTDLGGSAEVLDSVFRINDDGDPTKQIAFEASGIATGEVRTISMPNENVDLADLATNTASVGHLVTLSGVSSGADDLGTFTGTTIADASTVKQALQALETSVELKAADSIVIKKDGSVAFTANQPMGGFKLTGLAAGSTAGDSVRYEQAILATGVNAFSADQSHGGFKITNLADPVANTDAVNLQYMNARIAGVKPKQAVRVASTANVVIASALEAGDSIDGVTLVAGDRVLLKNQTAAETNGIYIASASGAASRSTDFDELSPVDEINGSWVSVQEGTQAGQIWVQFGTVVTLGTTAINFEYFNPIAGLIGGDMITFSSSTFSVDLHSTSGLESSNAGNAAGQLRVKLEASNPSLKITGSNELGAKLDAAGAITSGASGLIVGTDDSTIEKSANALRVKDAGITDAKVATGIDAAKLADGSVSNTEFQYLSTVTSNVQDQLDAKVTGPASATDNALARFDATTGKLVQNSGVTLDDSQNLTGVNVHINTAGQKFGSSTSLFFEQEYIEATLTASQTNTVLAALTVAHASFEGLMIDYKIKEATTSRVRIGTLYITTNGTDTSLSDSFTESGDVGTTWSLGINGANLEVKYTTTANAKTMKCVVKRIKA